VILFAPTVIGFPDNAGIAVQTTSNHSPARLKRELQLGYFGCSFQHVRCISLAASASLLSSVTAFELIVVIICENEEMSRLGKCRRAQARF